MYMYIYVPGCELDACRTGAASRAATELSGFGSSNTENSGLPEVGAFLFLGAFIGEPYYLGLRLGAPDFHTGSYSDDLAKDSSF